MTTNAKLQSILKKTSVPDSAAPVRKPADNDVDDALFPTQQPAESAAARKARIAAHAQSRLAGEADKAHSRDVAIRQAKLIHAQRRIESLILAAIEQMIDFPDVATEQALERARSSFAAAETLHSAARRPGEVGEFKSAADTAPAPEQPGSTTTTAGQPSAPPSRTESDPANPPALAVQLMQRHLSLFQPSDFDDLIEERQVAGRCGYVLCGRAPRTGGGGRYRVVGKAGLAGARIVDRRAVEGWCSDECARRAVFIKVQLQEEPVALREMMQTPPVRLMEERGTATVKPVPELHREPVQSQQARPDRTTAALDDPAMANALADLALERGGSEFTNIPGLVKDAIVNRDRVRPPLPPQRVPGTANSIEGYVPLTRTRWIDSEPVVEKE